MSSKKRPYVPKIKGCYPCSRRRIHCDRTEPICQKCATRGLHCTGLGLKLRFPYGAPFSIAATQATSGSDQSNLPNACHTQDSINVCHDNFNQADAYPYVPISANSSGPTENISSFFSLCQTKGSRFPNPSAQQEFGEDIFDHEAAGTSEGEELDSHGMSLVSSHQIGGLLHVPAESTPLWKRMMCAYFSDNIAPEMTAVDGNHNEWRHLVLSLAQTDNLVMNAVITVASYHLEFNKFTHRQRRTKSELSTIRNVLRDPNEMYNRVILGLRNQPELTSGDTKISVSITILILFVGAMVTGGSDFLLLSKMLESAIAAMGGEDHLPRVHASDFIRNQNHKIRLYAAPLLDEEKGIEFISSQTHKEELFSSLTHRLLESPEHNPTMMLVQDLVQQALDLYMEQFIYVAADQASKEAGILSCVIRVQHFKETLEAFPQGAPGERVLVWACFIAASASTLDEHKEFFERILLRHQSRNGFINILEGLECLRRIWNRSSQERWTSLLAQVNVLVM